MVGSPERASVQGEGSREVLGLVTKGPWQGVILLFLVLAQLKDRQASLASQLVAVVSVLVEPVTTAVVLSVAAAVVEVFVVVAAVAALQSVDDELVLDVAELVSAAPDDVAVAPRELFPSLAVVPAASDEFALLLSVVTTTFVVV